MTPPAPYEDLLRELAPQALGALVHRFRSFEDCEDAVQEALLAAIRQWPVEGVPERPRAWLVTVASRRLTDRIRSDAARRRREETTAPATIDPVGAGASAPVYLWGDTGTGKTRLLRALAVQRQAEGERVGWFDAAM